MHQLREAIIVAGHVYEINNRVEYGAGLQLERDESNAIVETIASNRSNANSATNIRLWGATRAVEATANAGINARTNSRTSIIARDYHSSHQQRFGRQNHDDHREHGQRHVQNGP
jgi:hypothetical protein